MTRKIWFITGTSRGFGREWAIAALERGDPVAATARDPSTLDDLVASYGDASCRSQLDVTDRDADFAAVAAGARALRPPRRRGQQRRLRPVRHGRGAHRAGGARADRDQPVRGALGDPGGAAVPARAGRRAHPAGLVDRRDQRVPAASASTTPRSGRSEGISQALAQEVAAFGIKVTLIEPGGFATDWGGSSSKHAEPLAAYADCTRPVRAAPRADRRAGRPARVGRGRAASSWTPTSRRCACFFGTRAAGHREGRLRARLATWEKWQPVAEMAQG